MMAVARAVAAFAALFDAVVAQGPWPMEDHLLHPLSGDANVGRDWWMTGTVVPTKTTLTIQPGVPNRQGMMWSMAPVPSDDFEVNAELSVRTPENMESGFEEGFALWYVYENATAAQEQIAFDELCNQEAIMSRRWIKKMYSAGFNLLGYRPKFNGFGLFFIDSASGPVVSTIANKGDQPIMFRLKQDFPNSRTVGKYDDGTPFHVNLRFKGGNVKVDFHGALSYSWDVPFDVRSGGYFGITSSGGRKKSAISVAPCKTVKLHDLTILSHDKQYQLERAKPPPAPKKDPEDMEDILRESSERKDFRKEGEAIEALINIAFKLIMETAPQQNRINAAIETMKKKLEVMEQAFQQLQEEVDIKAGHHIIDDFKKIKDEISHLSVAATDGHKQHQETLDLLHQDISSVQTASSHSNLDDHLNKVTESHQRTLNTLTSGHQQTFGVSVLAIVLVMVAGLALYNKFRSWEKKHVL